MNAPMQLAARDEYETETGLPSTGSRVWISGFTRHEHEEAARLLGLHGLKPTAFANGADAMLVPAPPSAEKLAEAERTGRRLLVPDDLRTAVRSGHRRTALDVTADTVRILDVTLPRCPAGGRRVPPAEPFAHLCLDSLFMKAARSVAIAAAARLPCALEGETAVAKSTAVLWVASLCRQGAVRLNLNGQSDAGELVGRFVPNGHAAEPGDHHPPAAWRFWEGIVPDAMRHGHWVLLDEINLAEPQVLERLNPVLESPPSLVLAENRGERFGPDGDVPVADSFRIFATMNPAEYAGRSVLSPAFRDRWSLWNQLEAPGEPEFRLMLDRLVHGTQPEFTLDGVIWRAPDAEPVLPDLADEPGIDGLLDAIASFHSAVAAASGNGHAAELGRGRRERYVFTRRTLLAQMNLFADLVARGSDAGRAAELVAEIEQLVRIAARRPRLVVTEGESDCTWSFNWADDVVTVNPDHVRQFAPDFCRGLALHEAAHAAVTRLHDILSWSLLRLYLPLLNTIEDIRIETWMRARFPGAMPWVRAYNDSLFAEVHAAPLPRSRAVQFLRSVLELWWYGAAPDGILPEVATALVACQEPIAEAAACQPPVQDDEAGIMASQRAMWEIIRARILPSWERLIALDRREGIESQAMEEFRRFTRALGHGSGRRGPVRRRVGRRPTSTASAGATAAAQAISETLRTDGSDDYLAAWKRIAHLADPLGDALLRTLVPRRRLRWSAGHASGTRLDLRRAMEFDIDPAIYRSLWMRPVVPARRDPAVAVLLDRSKSMQHERLIDRAFEGLVLLLEVCHRIGVPVAAWSFARECRQEIGWDTPLDESARRRLGRIPRSAHGRTMMDTALVTVGDSLARRTADPKLLFVLSDGCPDNHGATTIEIVNLEEAGIFPIGLGLGPGTADLARLFPASETEIPAERIVEGVAGLLSETLLSQA